MSIVLHFLLIILLSGNGWSVLLEKENVTSGSAVKLFNKGYRMRLHSHNIQYGSGSGQQSVTGVSSETDANSYWQVRSPTDGHIPRGEAIQCGQVIRLMHIQTTCNLHSHRVSSPLSHELEVSCYGNDGDGDRLDNWTVDCSGKYWKREQYVRFRHKGTGAFLGSLGHTYGRPIDGQYEVVATNKNADNSGMFWKTAEGLFIKPSETQF